MTSVNGQLGVVVIGRNEGERLRACLQSVMSRASLVVYVDSGSTDGSVALARSMGAEVVELDLQLPFTAARARNAGAAKLLERLPNIEFIQVVDGDCEIVDGWLERAIAEMRSHEKAAVVCGRRRERNPEASIYNRLCDLEWNTPVGEADSCGGDALIRTSAFREVGGYDESIIAGEEPEMCLRMRIADWTVRRIDHEMTLHDAQMTRFGQWWKRTVRSGHAYAEGCAMHGKAHGHFVHQVRSIVLWALLLPLVAIGLTWMTWGASLLLLGAYGLLWYRVRKHRLAHGDSPADASMYAFYCVLGKFAQLIGVGQYWFNRLRGKRTRIIEYKGAGNTVSSAHGPVAEAQNP